MSALLQAIRDSLDGEHRRYTEGPIGRAIVLLAIPMILETAMESLFAIVDIFFVARLGGEAVATVGLTESLMTFVFAIAMGLSFSTTAYVARRIGEGHARQAARGAMQSLLLGLVAAAAIGVVGALYGPALLALMGADEAVLRHGIYARIVIGGSGTVLFLFLANAIFRGAGDAVIAMRVLWLANAINIVLNPCLIFGLGPFPELGIAGSAVGTVIGRGCGVLYQLWHLFRGSGNLRVELGDFRPDRALAAHLLRPALNGMFQIFVATASWTALVRIASTFGSGALAGYTVAVRVVIFSILPSWGLCNAAATLVGQNLGAGQPERAEAAVWRAGRYNAYFLGALSVIFFIAAGPVIGLFTNEPAAVEVGVTGLRIFAASYVFLAYGMMMQQAFNGAGDTATPTRINLICYWAIQIPLAWGLAKTAGLGPSGIFLAVFGAQCSLAVVSILWFRRGRWKLQQI